MSTVVGTVDGLLAGRYRLTDRLAAGGTGEVWQAVDVLLDRPVAVTTLRADRAWLVMELVDGEPLPDVLRRAGRLDVARALHVVAQRHLAPEQAGGRDGAHSGDVCAWGVVTYEFGAGVRLVVGEHPGPVQQRVPRTIGPQAATPLLAPVVAHPDEPLPRSGSAVSRNRGVASRATSLRGQRQAVRATAVVLALLAVGLGLTGTWDAAATVPALPPGTLEAQATADVVDAGLLPTTEHASSSSVPRGQLLSVRPVAGTGLERGDQVVLVVSSGPPPVRLPADVVVPESGVDRDSPGPAEENGKGEAP